MASIKVDIPPPSPCRGKFLKGSDKKKLTNENKAKYESIWSYIQLCLECASPPHGTRDRNQIRFQVCFFNKIFNVYCLN